MQLQYAFMCFVNAKGTMRLLESEKLNENSSRKFDDK